jgi:hypothetical protein
MVHKREFQVRGNQMPNISLNDLTDATCRRISLIQAESQFKDGETLRLKDILLGLVELESIHAIAML